MLKSFTWIKYQENKARSGLDAPAREKAKNNLNLLCLW